MDYSDSIDELRAEVKILKKQVRKLKKMMLVSIFDSKEDMKDFFSDIW